MTNYHDIEPDSTIRITSRIVQHQARIQGNFSGQVPPQMKIRVEKGERLEIWQKCYFFSRFPPKLDLLVK